MCPVWWLVWWRHKNKTPTTFTWWGPVFLEHCHGFHVTRASQAASHVALPMRPSTGKCFSRWKARATARVRGPYRPSALMFHPRAFIRACHTLRWSRLPWYPDTDRFEPERGPNLNSYVRHNGRGGAWNDNGLGREAKTDLNK